MKNMLIATVETIPMRIGLDGRGVSTSRPLVRTSPDVEAIHQRKGVRRRQRAHAGTCLVRRRWVRGQAAPPRSAAVVHDEPVTGHVQRSVATFDSQDGDRAASPGTIDGESRRPGRPRAFDHDVSWWCVIPSAVTNLVYVVSCQLLSERQALLVQPQYLNGRGAKRSGNLRG
nr:hypothetical protein [Kribbella turkmenica]